MYHLFGIGKIWASFEEESVRKLKQFYDIMVEFRSTGFENYGWNTIWTFRFRGST